MGGVASLARATPMRPDERLPRKRTLSTGSRVPPAVTITRASGERAGREQLLDARRDLPGLRQPAHPPLALGELALVRADQLDAPRQQQLGVRARRGMRPHARIHRRCDEDRPAMGERRLGEHVVGDPTRELGERVRGARRDDQQVGARQMRIRILAAVAGGPAQRTSRRARSARRPV